jgi:hypothetical protein
LNRQLLNRIPLYRDLDFLSTIKKKNGEARIRRVDIAFSKKLPRVSNGFEIDVASDQLSAQPHNSHSNSEKKTSHNIE